MRVPSRTLKADGALLFCSALLIGANISIAHNVSRALRETSIGDSQRLAPGIASQSTEQQSRGTDF
jgi:hypothetical protein